MSTQFPAMFLARPPLVKQSDPYVCWSAALESWLQATQHPRQMTQRQIQDAFIFGQRRTDFTSSIGGLTLPKGFENLAREFDMACERISLNEFGARKLYQLLANKKHVFLVYPVPGAASHAVVAYGIGIMNPKRGYELAVMDPFPLRRDGGYDEDGTARLRALGDELSGMVRFEPLFPAEGRAFFLGWRK